MDSDSGISRRRLLATTGSISLAGLAGCVGGTSGHHNEIPERTVDDRAQPLPDGAENCVSTMGEERDPESVSAKEEVDYQFSPNYTGDSGYMEMCANCRFFCPGGSLDSPIGACVLVDGGIRSQDWCALWQGVDGLQERERSGARGSQSEN